MADIGNEWGEPVTNGGQFIKFKNVGEVAIGTFTGKVTKEFSQKFGKEQTVYFFTTEQGVPFRIGASGELKTKLPDMVAGKVYRIEYTGQKDIGKGNPMKCFDVRAKRA